MDESTPHKLPEASTATADASVSETPPAVAPIEAELERLPTFARGLMRIRVPIQVTLAAQRKSIQEIVELGPGSIVKFDKTCDEPLELSIGNRTIAQGEVVKVGDKFGLRISGLVK
jgi:flagellar motor switch protein FliN